jgi:mannose/fructose/N-acetylgalactosamine-specific phosphotransferase system component IID
MPEKVIRDTTAIDSHNASKKDPLTKKELRQIYLRYAFLPEAAMSYEKMHGATWAWTYLPLGEKYYKNDPAALRRLLMRHSVFYNTEPQTGQLVNGIVCSLEEKIGMGEPISEDVPVSVKASLMGPLAGIGDSLVQGILIPILLSVAMGLSVGGNPIGPIFYIIAYAAIMVTVTIVCFRSGYRLGTKAIDAIIGESARRITNMFTTLGTIVIGALAASTIALTTSISIPFGTDGTQKALQDILDGFFPGIFPLTMVLFSWWLISSKRYSATKTLVVLTIIVTIGVVIGLFGSVPTE